MCWCICAKRRKQTHAMPSLSEQKEHFECIKPNRAYGTLRNTLDIALAVLLRTHSASVYYYQCLKICSATLLAATLKCQIPAIIYCWQFKSSMHYSNTHSGHFIKYPIHNPGNILMVRHLQIVKCFLFLCARCPLAVLSQDIPHIFAMTLFEEYIYWTDWETKSINRAHKTLGTNKTTLISTLHRPMDVHIYHPYRQPKGNALNVEAITQSQILLLFLNHYGGTLIPINYISLQSAVVQRSEM